MNGLTELATSLQGQLRESIAQEYLRALEEVHTKLEASARAFLKSPQAAKEVATPKSGQAQRANTEIVETAMRSLAKPEFTWADVRDTLRRQGVSLTDEQIGTAFRKLKRRKRPP